VDQSEASDPRLHAGVYRVDGRFVAVNRPVAENSLNRLTPEGARKLFQNLSFRLHEERGTGTDRLQGEIWRVFVTLMLLFLIAEGLLILPTSTPTPAVPKPRSPEREPSEVPA
jgi:hypothetical protein